MHNEAKNICAPTNRHGRDGRVRCACGSIANPAGFCCETGTPIAIPDGAYVVDTNGAHLHFINQAGTTCDWCHQVQDLVNMNTEGTKR